MPSRSKSFQVASFVVVFFGACCSGQQRGGELQAEEIIRLIPRSEDIYDFGDRGDRLKLVALGEKAYPALAVALLAMDSRVKASRILSIIADSSGDKAVPLAAIREFLEKWKDGSSYPAEYMRAIAISSVGEFGGKGEYDILFDMMNDSSEMVRNVTAESLAKTGDASVFSKLSSMREKRKHGFTEEDLRKDSSISHTEAALKILAMRLAATPATLSIPQKAAGTAATPPSTFESTREEAAPTVSSIAETNRTKAWTVGGILTVLLVLFCARRWRSGH